MSATTAWVVVLGCAVGCYLLKLAGLSVPPRVLRNQVVQRVADLIPVALLAALIAVQMFASDESGHQVLTLDARVAALGMAALALWLRAPFLVVVVVAAATAALLRLAGLP